MNRGAPDRRSPRLYCDSDRGILSPPAGRLGHHVAPSRPERPENSPVPADHGFRLDETTLFADRSTESTAVPEESISGGRLGSVHTSAAKQQSGGEERCRTQERNTPTLSTRSKKFSEFVVFFFLFLSLCVGGGVFFFVVVFFFFLCWLLRVVFRLFSLSGLG